MRKVSYYLKFALALVGPLAGMYFLLDKTEIPAPVVIILAIVLSAGMLFIFGVINVPTTELEKLLLEEESFLRKIRNSNRKLTELASECNSDSLAAAISPLVENSARLETLLGSDAFDSTELAKQIYKLLYEASGSIEPINRLNLEEDNVVFGVLTEKVNSLTSILEVMLEEYEKGTIENAVQGLKILEQQLRARGF